ncbi:helix-turn-helix domain-containing protein [Pseudonocardia pini]|uniref:helix-turn-helix domain-containing protein n=1 Tax=Pseudonocardia pini TaxID=2758030 RepID=UPI0015F047F4|nr:helix-turn-helix domain-containing protein [Pseudonocardia pini]
MVLAAGSAPGGTDVRATHRFDEWRDAIRHDFVTLDIAPDRRIGTFQGSVRSATVGHLQVSEVCSIDQTCRRTPSLAATDRHDYLQIGMITEGTGVLEQDGRRAALAAGDYAIYETGRPFSWRFTGSWRMEVFTWPRASIALCEAESASATAVRLAGREGFSGIVGGMLRALLAGPPQLTAGGATRVADEAGALVSTLAVERLAGPTAPDRPQEALLREMLRYVDTHLADPELGPAAIARAHFVSVRQLHRLFAASGESVNRRIRRLRLEHSRRELADRRRAGLAVTDVARRWGFPDLPTFSRAFRQTYGEAPTAYRARLLG